MKIRYFANLNLFFNCGSFYKTKPDFSWWKIRLHKIITQNNIHAFLNSIPMIPGNLNTFLKF